jgi:hypothetical protein
VHGKKERRKERDKVRRNLLFPADDTRYEENQNGIHCMNQDIPQMPETCFLSPQIVVQPEGQIQQRSIVATMAAGDKDPPQTNLVAIQ